MVDMKRLEEHQGKHQELHGSKDPDVRGQCFVLLNSPAGLSQNKGGYFQQWGISLGNLLLKDMFSTDHFPGFEGNRGNPGRRNALMDFE